MAGELEGKVAIVTGGARGLGRGVVEVFVEEGARVVIADLLEEEGRALANQLGEAVRFCRTDISCREQVQALVDHAIAEFGRLDVMMNNAGISDNDFSSLLDTDFAAFEKIMAVNVKGVMLGTQIAARHMARQGGGSIINTSSISGIQAGFGFFCYRASKAAVVNFTKTAACELGVHLVRVNCICPGNIPSEMGTFATAPGEDAARQAAITQAVREVRMGYQPLKRQGVARDIGNGALYFASDRSAQVTGQILAIDGGATCGDSRSQIADILAARAEVEARFKA
ncbi:MAG: SDR family oxidoreductase [Novosphingobium sp.]|nr:SDR family oxidoreductase [Novosphingobium sp.]